MHYIKIGCSKAQLRKLRQGKTIQLKLSHLQGNDVTISVSDKTQKKIDSCIRRGKGMRLTDYTLVSEDGEDPMGDGFNLKKLGGYARMGAKLATSVIPKDVAMQAAANLPGMSGKAAALGVAGLYASQGKGLFSKAMKVAKIGAKFVPKSVVQAGASYALQKAGVSAETAGQIAKVGTNVGYSAIENAPSGSGIGKGSAAMREKMARLRSMRKGRGNGMVPIGSGMIPIGGSVRSSNPLILDSRSEIFDSNGGNFLKKRRA